VVLCGFVVVLLTGLYPPWTITYVSFGERVQLPLPQPSGGSVVGPGYAYSHEYGVGHKCFFQYPRWWNIGHPHWVAETDGEAEHYYEINASLLLAQWFLVSAVTGIIVMYLGDRRRSPANKPRE
jgi:hypothetical protein